MILPLDNLALCSLSLFQGDFLVLASRTEVVVASMVMESSLEGYVWAPSPPVMVVVSCLQDWLKNSCKQPWRVFGNIQEEEP